MRIHCTAQRTGRRQIFRISAGRLRPFPEPAASFASAFFTFFATTCLAIFSLLAWNLFGHHTVNYADSYLYIGLPAGVIRAARCASCLRDPLGPGQDSRGRNIAMPVHTIRSPNALNSGAADFREQARAWCAQLEAGSILYFPRTPVPIPDADLEFLLGQQQIEQPAQEHRLQARSRLA